VLDRLLHVAAVLLAVGGIALTLPIGSVRQLIGLAAYGVGLIGMFVVSAA